MNADERTLSFEELKDLGRQLLETGKSVNFTLGGTSMFPYLREGDVATVIKIPVHSLKMGHVVVFEQNGKWIAHRLVAIHETGTNLVLQSQGDSIIRPDRPIEKDNYLGVLTACSRNGVPQQLNSFLNRFMAWCMVKLRPFPQLLARLALGVRNRMFRA